MKKLLLAFLFLSVVGKSQVNCNQSSFGPTKTYSTGTTSSYTVNNSTAFLYLCPSATVYDTITNLFCRQVIVNPGAKYVIKYMTCGGNIIYVKATGTVQVLATSNSGTISIVSEAGAVIVNQSTLSISTVTCATIQTPSINCTATGVTEFTGVKNQMTIYPNPANDKLTIETMWGSSFNEAEVSITNLLGSVVYDKKSVGGQKLEIDLKNLQSGVYYLSVNSANATETRKIVVSK